MGLMHIPQCTWDALHWKKRSMGGNWSKNQFSPPYLQRMFTKKKENYIHWVDKIKNISSVLTFQWGGCTCDALKNRSMKVTTQVKVDFLHLAKDFHKKKSHQKVQNCIHFSSKSVHNVRCMVQWHIRCNFRRDQRVAAQIKKENARLGFDKIAFNARITKFKIRW